MPFTAAQLTAFWTSQDQMGLIARTCTQMAAEGLSIPADFEDFAEKKNLEALFKLILKLVKVPHGPAAQGLLQEIASFIIPASDLP